MSFSQKIQDYKIIMDQNDDKYKEIIEESIDSLSSSVTIYKNNKKIFNLKNKQNEELIETLSITKSFCAMAIMFLIQDKKIKSINDLIGKYIQSWSYGKKKDISIKHILTHTSGLDTNWSYENFMWPHGDYKSYIKGKGIKPNIEEMSLAIDKIDENDKKWFYNDTATQILPTLVKRITGIEISLYLNKKLFKPLNIKFKWNKDDSGSSYGPNGLMISTDGLCKVGMMIMNDGIWNGKKILDIKLINSMTRKRIDQKDMKKCKLFKYTDKTGYGLLWYKLNDLIIAEGYLGQQLVIDKKRKLVGARLIQSNWNKDKFKEESKKVNYHLENFPYLLKKFN